MGAGNGRATGTSKQRKPTVLSAFSGIGGLDLGLEKAGFKTIGCIELDPVARASLMANRDGEWPILEPHDVAEFAGKPAERNLVLEPGDVDVLAGGPPCQPFSKAAQWSPRGAAGIKDARAQCLEGFLSLAEQLLPAAVLIENVQGFVQGRRSALPMIESWFHRINQAHGTSYRLSVRIIDAADCGVPQRRRRAIIVALRDGQAFDWPRGCDPNDHVSAWDAIGNLRAEKLPPMRGRFADLLPSVPEGCNYLHFTDRGRAPKKLFGYRTKFWSFLLKLSKSQPAWTLAAHPGPSTGPFHWDNRPLAVPEMLRLQSFPSDWKLTGTYRDQVRQVGNATPPLLVEGIGRAIGRQLFGLSYRGRRALAISRRRFVPPSRRAAPIPKKYWSLDGEHPAHRGTGRGPRPIASER